MRKDHWDLPSEDLEGSPDGAILHCIRVLTADMQGELPSFVRAMEPGAKMVRKSQLIGQGGRTLSMEVTLSVKVYPPGPLPHD